MATDHFVNISRAILVQLLIATEDHDRDVNGTQDGKLMSLLEQSTFSFQERSELDVSFDSSRYREFGITYTERLRSSLIGFISI
jgi:hypothetical protein